MKRGRSILLALMAVLVASACGGPKPTPTPTPTLSQPDRVAQIEKATVELTGKLSSTSGSTVGGSGVIINATKGWVLTNAHVVTGLATLTIRFNDGSTSAGRVIAQDPCDDLALVLIVSKPNTPLTRLPIGDSSKVRAGDHVTAVGYPASLQASSSEIPTATEGSVSAVGVKTDSSTGDPSLPNYTSLIQHQAPINPGNSGGPLVNDAGQLIGINSLANTLQGGRAIQGQYYAISSNHIEALLPGLEAGISTDYAGWDLLPNSAEVDAYVRNNTTPSTPEPSEKGLFVFSVEPGSPADTAMVEWGDAVLTVDGVDVSSFQDVCDILASHGPGQTLDLYLSSVLDTKGPGYYTAKLTLR